MDTNDAPEQPDVPVVDMWGDDEGGQVAGGDGGDATPPARHMRARGAIAAGVTAVAIAVAAFVGLHVGDSGAKSTTNRSGAPSASGAPGNGFGGFGGANRGTITAINGSTIVMKTASGTSVTVKTTSSTTANAVVASSLSKLAVGDHVMVTGTTSSSKIAATRVVDTGTQSTFAGPGGPGGFGGTPPSGANGATGSGAPSGTPPNGASGSGFGGTPPSGANGTNGRGPSGGFPTGGTITAINGSSFTVKTMAGSTVTVTTGTSTTFSAEQSSSLSALKVGDTISVRSNTRPSANTAASTTITAASITEGDLGGGM
jgi:hypothetical protein